MGKRDDNMMLSNQSLQPTAPRFPMHIYEVRPRKGHRGVDLISDALPFGRLRYAKPNAASNAIDHAKLYSRPALQMAVNDQ
jgi:hypothetical protein